MNVSSVHSQVNVLIGAKVFGDGNAVEVLADLAVVDGSDVEEQQQADEEEDDAGEADDDQDQLPPTVVDPPEGDEGQERVGEEEPEDEAEQVGVVVHPGKESGQEEDGRDADQLEDGHFRVLEHVPLVDHLDHAAGEQAEVRARGSDLSSVGNEDGGGEVADHAGAHVDERDSGGSGHLLQVAHQPVLQSHCQGKVENTEM